MNSNYSIILEKISSNDCVAALWHKIEHEYSTEVILVSCYLPYDSPHPPPSQDMVNVVEYCKRKQKQLVIGCDANAHHTVWGSTNTNERGKSLLDFLLSSDLFLMNKGCKPTFRNRHREQVIDITLASGRIHESIKNWHVSDELSLSDHSWICFDVSSDRKIAEPFRNPNKTNWQKYKEILDSKLDIVGAPSELTLTQDIETEANFLTQSLVESFIEACPLSKPNSNARQTWMTGEILNKRKEVRRLHNRAKNNDSDSLWDDYINAQREYKKICRKAQRESWKSFTEQINSVSETARIKKILAKTHTQPELLEYADGRRSDSTKESLEILLNANFPGCLGSRANLENTSSRIPAETGLQINELVSTEKVRWAINSFKPYKSPGKDGVYPALLQNTSMAFVDRLCDTYRACLKLGYIPVSWQESKVIFIPKPGKNSYASSNAYRPISLTSFLLKTLERIIEVELRSKISNSTLSRYQHAYCKGRSVESALHNVVHIIEKAFTVKNSTLGMFIDIEGAFNNVKTDSMIDSLNRKGVHPLLVNWISFMLRNRVIHANFGNSSEVGYARNGTPQGGILSPLLWLLVMDDLLQELTEAGYHIVCYADDLAILATGKFENTLAELMQSALTIVRRWATKNGLRINPGKTELCLFTKKRRIPNINLPKIDDIRLTLTDRVKFLGVILDKKLQWKHHLQQKASKAIKVFWTCRSAIGKKWGLLPKQIHWIYISVIRPILTYGAIVWWNSLSIGSNLKIYERVQRQCCLGITGAIRSTPTRALETVLNIHQIDIHVRKVAANTAIRLNLNGKWLKTHQGTPHEEIAEIIAAAGYNIDNVSDYIIKQVKFNDKYTVRLPSRREWENGNPIPRNSMVIYTDGSKMETGCGAGIFADDPDLAISFRLDHHCTIFQAEIAAINKAAITLNLQQITDKRIVICSDSQAALKALANKAVKSKIVQECRENLNLLANRNVLKILWSPGHCMIVGNETADEMARHGATNDSLEVYQIGHPATFSKMLLENWAKHSNTLRWTDLNGCVNTKLFWGCPDIKKTRSILSMNKATARLYTGIVTGHIILRKHAARLGLTSNSQCRGCEEEEESLEHLLCHCPSVRLRRLKNLDCHFLNNLEEAAEIKPSKLINFLKEVGWVDEL